MDQHRNSDSAPSPNAATPAASSDGAVEAHPADGKAVRELISERAIQEKVNELAQAIRRDAGEQEIVLLCILKGSVMFTADLARALSRLDSMAAPRPLSIEFLGVASYGDAQESSGVVQITSDLTQPIAGKYVVLVEDIVDTGLTLSYLTQILRARGPKELKVCSLLLKPSGASPVLPDYYGFEVGDDFVVGYGLDFAQRLRQLPFIGAM